MNTQSLGSSNNPYQYTGREQDQSGLYYYRARYYHPGMGRFISEGPIGLRGGLNMHAYVDGNPISLIDPLGFAGKTPSKTFPKFQQLWWNYPRTPQGKPPIHPSVDTYPNQCAIRMGSAFMKSGMNLSSYPKVNLTTDGYPRAAQGLADWLSQNYGRPQVMTYSEFEQNWAKQKGVIFIKGESGQSSHIDLFNGGYNGSGYSRGTEIWYWPVD